LQPRGRVGVDDTQYIEKSTSANITQVRIDNNDDDASILSNDQICAISIGLTHPQLNLNSDPQQCQQPMSRDMSAETRQYMETGEDRTKERTELFLGLI